MVVLWVMAVVAFGTAGLLCFALADSRAPWFIADEANERSLHDGVKPRGGGLGVIFAVVVSLAVVGYAGYVSQHFTTVLLAALLVAAISLVDDWRGVSALWRVIVHTVAAVIAVIDISRGYGSSPAFELDILLVLSAVVAVFALVWMTNLYNFMDGMDGFAGGMGLVGFGVMALLGVGVGAWHFTLICLSVAAACAGFLVANFPPARIFMGDVGASTLGFLAGALILWADVHRIFPWWVGVMVFSPFIVDATVTLGRRALAREQVWRAHRSHFYQRVVRLGWSHTRTVCCGYVLMLVSAAAALWAYFAQPLVQWFLVILLALTYTGLMLLITGMERRQGLDLVNLEFADRESASSRVLDSDSLATGDDDGRYGTHRDPLDREWPS